MISVVIPVYKNSENIPSLIQALDRLKKQLPDDMEVVFVIDGSPDDSALQLAAAAPMMAMPTQLIGLSRRFGSFAAVRAGLEAARGTIVAVMAADLQEPPDLIVEFQRALATGEFDVAVGQRTARADPLFSRLAASVFWGLLRRFVLPDLPRGGVDVFAVTARVRDIMIRLREVNSSLVGVLFWVGFRRIAVPYIRRRRMLGKSAWTFRNKTRYLMDSVFAFSDLPILLLTRIGLLGLVVSILFGTVVVLAKVLGSIPIPGYAATISVVTFFGALNCFGIGILGAYIWRIFENSKQRPNFIVATHDSFDGKIDSDRSTGHENRA